MGVYTVNLVQAKQTVKDLNNFIKLTEECIPDSIEKKAIKEYAIYGSVSKVAKIFNYSGIMIKNKKVKPTDISNIILSKPYLNELHMIVQEIFKSNKRKTPFL